MRKFNTHQVTMGIKKLIKQQNLKQKRHIAPKSKEFRSWILRKVIDNGKNNSLNIWILDNPKIWGTHLNRHEGVMPFKKSLSYHWDTLFLSSFKICSTSLIVSAACDNFIDGCRRTWIMFSFHQVLCKSFWNTFHKSGPKEDPFLFHTNHWLFLDRFLPCTFFRKNMTVSNLVLFWKAIKSSQFGNQ